MSLQSNRRSIEIEFVLTSAQHEAMGYAGLSQGQSLSMVLDMGVLLPDPAAEQWFFVQKAPLKSQFVQVGPAMYAFAGQIREAELFTDAGEETALLTVDCGDVPLRVTCAPMEDGRLPFGTWETRYLAGVSRLQGVLEEDFSLSLGEYVGVTVWGVRRLILAPGDPLFGEWRETIELPATPFTYDLVLIQGHLHRRDV